MLKLTPAAAAQIAKSAAEAEGLALRFAARRKEDGSIEHIMGFDAVGDDDVHTVSEGIDLVYATEYTELLQGTQVDYQELENGESAFVFFNPNDAAQG